MDLDLLPKQLDKVCRVCLKVCYQDTNVRSVFEELRKKEILDDNFFFVYEILHAVTSVQIVKGDGYPTLICRSCMNQASSAYKFKKQYEQSHQIISQCINQKPDKSCPAEEEETDVNNEVEDVDLNHKSCLSSDIFELSGVNTENVSIESLLKKLNSQALENQPKPKIKNVNMLNENKIARKCPDCKYVFQTAYAFHNHACNREHLDRKLCPICGKSISKSHFNKHLYMHSGRRDYVCQICNKSYNASGSLKFHLATHTGEKPYLCSLCGKRFIQPTALKYHMRFHNNERRYKCNFCDKSFIMQCHLVAHELVHTGLKPFTCDICHKGFIRKVQLRSHMYTHTGKKPYKCRLCDKSFVRKTQVNLHEMIHSGKRPYECKICGKGFIQKQPLLIHLKVHQKNKEADDADVPEEEEQVEEEIVNELDDCLVSSMENLVEDER